MRHYKIAESNIAYAGSAPALRNDYGLLLWHEGNLKEAERVFVDALDLNPNFVEVANSLISFFLIDVRYTFLFIKTKSPVK